MDLSAGSLYASLMISTVGFAIFIYGKKQQRLPQLVTGILLMVFPYFVPGVAPMIAVAATLIAAMWATTKFVDL